MQQVLGNCAAHPTLRRVYLHVHEGNEDAQRFYERAGFAKEGVVADYFPRLSPPNAVIMTLPLGGAAGAAQ